MRTHIEQYEDTYSSTRDTYMAVQKHARLGYRSDQQRIDAYEDTYIAVRGTHIYSSTETRSLACDIAVTSNDSTRMRGLYTCLHTSAYVSISQHTSAYVTSNDSTRMRGLYTCLQCILWGLKRETERDTEGETKGQTDR